MEQTTSEMVSLYVVEEQEFQGRSVKKVSFSSFRDLRVRGVLSLPAGTDNRLPALLLIDHRRGIPVWGNEQPLEGHRWVARRPHYRDCRPGQPRPGGQLEEFWR